ncbi:MAG: hypothetical protein CUN55_04560 [Phototrophicales bacterium]|nr:MAG: hypothetical protein CUN55_04560 [Phototrophicales bacterium]
MNKQHINRRDLIKMMAAASAVGTIGRLWPSWMPRIAFANDGVQGDVLVCIFLRGGADALNMIVPFGDENYYRARPLLAFGRPDDRGGEKAIELTDFFGLNPDMRPFHELFLARHLVAIHAVGSPNAPRSHFEAMDMIERGVDNAASISSGWLGRHLMSTTGQNDSPLRALGWGENLQKSLHGYISANALQSIADFHLTGDRQLATEMSAALSMMYQNGTSLDNAAQSTLDALEIVRNINVDQYRPSHGASYEDNDFGRALKQTAALIKADAGLEVACIDQGNYDTHVAQGRTEGLLSGLVSSLSKNLRAFHDDLLDYMHRVTVVVMSEFGRRVQENGGGGTDHGHGGAMYVMSGNLDISSPVIAEWPGLNDNFLENGDLSITTDYRDILGEILIKRTPKTDLSVVFPNHSYRPLGIIK